MEQKPQDYPYNAVGMTMGTSYNIKASHLPDKITPKDINEQVKQVLDKVSGQMSTYQKDSELSLFNQNPSTDWIAVSAEVLRSYQRSLKN